MFEYFDKLYKTTDFMPHGACLVWDTSLLWQHVGSDIVTGTAYYLIAALLFYFILKRKDVPYFWVFLLFGFFILSCGTTHFFGAWTIYYPSYWTEGIVKTVNAVISLGTAIALFPLMPKLLALPSLQHALDKVDQLNTDLEQKVIRLEGEAQKRKEAEIEIFSQQAFLQNAIDALNDTFFVFDMSSGKALLWNKSFEIISGYSEEEIAKLKAPDSYYSKEDVEKARGHLERILNGAPETVELHLICKDGRRVLTECSTSVLKDIEGHPKTLISVGRDIADRKKAEDELKKSEERFRLLVENAPDAIFVRDKSSFVYLNNAALKLFGANSAYDLIGTSILERYLPQKRDEIRKRMQIINELHLAVSLHQSICLQLDGTEVDVESTAVPMTFQGEDGALVFLRDISERVEKEKQHQRLEEQLHQSQKIESLGRLAGGVAHDYNNMLSVIIGNVELAKIRVERSDPVEENLEQILQAAIRSSDITRQLLAFARKQIVNPKVLDLNASVEGMLKMLRNLLGENLDLSWQPKGLWPVKMDPSQLDQILANLCINARDAIADVGKMTIETDTVSFDEEYCKDHPGFIPGDFVLLAVSDNGCGMDKETLDNIFEPFFTTKQTGEGTGLGMATVYGIVKQSSGFINVYSEPGQGTTFHIYLPRCEEENVVVQEAAASEVLKGQGETVLLVEDEVAIVRLATAMLEDLGYRIMTANTPAKALRLAESHQGDIQLLLTDVVMPEMNGRELAMQIQKIYPNLKILYMSGYTANAIAHHGILNDGINYIQKPFSRTDLSIRVREVLGSDV